MVSSSSVSFWRPGRLVRASLVLGVVGFDTWAVSLPWVQRFLAQGRVPCLRRLDDAAHPDLEVRDAPYGESVCASDPGTLFGFTFEMLVLGSATIAASLRLARAFKPLPAGFAAMPLSFLGVVVFDYCTWAVMRFSCVLVFLASLHLLLRRLAATARPVTAKAATLASWALGPLFALSCVTHWFKDALWVPFALEVAGMVVGSAIPLVDFVVYDDAPQ